jgi:hypothetical protein
MGAKRHLQSDLPDYALIHARVDQALADNRRGEQHQLRMATMLFGMGLLTLLVGYLARNSYLQWSTEFLMGLLVMPMHEIRRLRRDNIILQAFPILISTLSRRAAQRETQKLLAYLRGEQPEQWSNIRGTRPRRTVGRLAVRHNGAGR